MSIELSLPLRRRYNDVVVRYDDEVIHDPPVWQTLEGRLTMLCEFANNDEPWIHPVVKAAILHFMLGYDHYFVDGNGRTARAIFYWYLLSRKYAIFQYLSISRHFLAARAKYAKAYLDSELDGGDLTYFIVYSMRVVQAALDDLQKYLQLIFLLDSPGAIAYNIRAATPSPPQVWKS